MYLLLVILRIIWIHVIQQEAGLLVLPALKRIDSPPITLDRVVHDQVMLALQAIFDFFE